MRRCLWFVPVVLLALHGPAAAKDEGFDWVVPGQRLTFQSDLVVRSAEQAAKLASGSLFAYLKPWNADPLFDPILVGPIEVRHLDPEHRYLRVRVSFEIPDVPSRLYALKFCTEGCEYSFDGVGPRLQVVASPLERKLRKLMKLRVYEFRSRIGALRSDLANEVEMRNIRQRYLADKLLDLARRVERLEGQRQQEPVRQQSVTPAIWLVTLGFGAGLVTTTLRKWMTR